MHASSKDQNMSEKQVALNLEMTVKQAMEMRIELKNALLIVFEHGIGLVSINN